MTDETPQPFPTVEVDPAEIADDLGAIDRANARAREHESLLDELSREGRPFCVFVDATMHTPDGYVPAVAYQDEPGFYPLSGNGNGASPWFWGHDLAAARKIAERANTERGVSPEQAREILLSSRRAQTRLGLWDQPS